MEEKAKMLQKIIQQLLNFSTITDIKHDVPRNMDINIREN